ncbi:MAG: phosphate ABC transporter substrate-binding protein [Candidatus Omnitrophota bacterium]
MKKLIAISGVALATLFLCAGAAHAKEKMIQIKGSDTIVNLSQAWAEEFMAENPQASLAVTGGGSGTGIAALINGTTDIANASRKIKKKELEDAQKAGYYPEEFKVAIDALAVIVNPANPVKELTIDQLSDIFTGKITNWNEVGGKNEKILVLSRERNSGTHMYFLEQVLRKGNEKGPEQFAPSVLMLPSSEAIINETSTSESAIGYDGLGYVSAKVKTIAVAKKNGEAFVPPSKETAMNRTYPIWRFLYMYTGFKPNGEIKAFIDFALSAKGQKIVEDMGFVSLAPLEIR